MMGERRDCLSIRVVDLIRFFVQRPIFHSLTEGDTLMKNNPRRILIVLTSLLIVSISLFAMPPNAQAVGVIYYVNCATGNDSDNGLSTSTPWRTTTRANQQTYSAGDQILFARGTTCSGAAFKPVGNGAVGNPVIVADYGTGSLPVIDGVGAHEPAVFLL